MPSFLQKLNPFAQADKDAAQLQAGTVVVQGEPGNIPPGTDVSAPPAPPAAPAPNLDTEGKIIPETLLDGFKNVWDTPKDDGKGGEQPPTTLNQKDLSELIAKTNFTDGATQEQLQAIQAGGEGASAAVAQMVNSAVQRATTTAIMASEKVTQQAVELAVAKVTDQIPELVRKHASTSHLKDSNPLFSNPAVQPIMTSLQTQLLQQNPGWSPQEVTTSIESFIEALAESVNAPGGPADSKGVTSGDPDKMDWDAYAGIKSSS